MPHSRMSFIQLTPEVDLFLRPLRALKKSDRKGFFLLAVDGSLFEGAQARLIHSWPEAQRQVYLKNCGLFSLRSQSVIFPDPDAGNGSYKCTDPLKQVFYSIRYEFLSPALPFGITDPRKVTEHPPETPAQRRKRKFGIK